MPDQPYELEDIDAKSLQELEGYHDLNEAPAESAGERNSRYFRFAAYGAFGIVILWIVIALVSNLSNRLHGVSSGYNKAVEQSMLAPGAISEPGAKIFHG